MPRHVFVRRSRIAAPAEAVYRWHARPGALERLSPPWDPPVVEARTGTIEDEGARVVLRVGPLRQRWVAEHHDAEPGRAFHDRLVEGPLPFWEHAHRMTPDGENACVLEDRIEYALPLGRAGDLAGGRAIRSRLERMFAYRHAVTAGDLADHAACPGDKTMKVAITGASGLVGRALVPYLTTGGHGVVRLVRRPSAAPDEAAWDPATGRIDPAALEGVDAVVHLAGEGIADRRWTAARKEALRASRVGPTRKLAETLAGLKRRPRVFVSASAIGYYGDTGDRWVDETSPAGDDFLGRLAAEWEEATAPAARAGIRVVSLRTGIVLSAKGGALGKMLPPFRAGLGGPLGPGTQYMSWIAMDDLIGAVHHALANDGVSGPLNATAPEPVTNAVFSRTLGRVLSRPAIAPAPAFALRLLFGEMADAALLSGARVRPAKLLAAGYRFRFDNLERALRHELGR
ncbi:MAG: TIGR01777 family oxidoreductase [Vicinamibacteria bacterium]